MTKSRLLIPVVLAGTLTASVSIRSRPAARPSVMPSLGAEIRECPRELGKEFSAEWILTSGTAGIPEYNDCQRFVVDGKFDSLFAIYSTHPDTVEFGPDWAVLVAVVRGFGGGYPTLGIRPGLNCLYLYNQRQSARMIDSASHFPCKEKVMVSGLTGQLLESRPVVARGFTNESDYPPVARWDWDERNGHQYLGVSCDAAWCEIGKTGFMASKSWTPSPFLPRAMKRNMMIKGWYDEQRVAGPPPASGGPLPTLSNVRGVIFPHYQLREYEDETWVGDWRTVAYVALSAKSPKYLETMNLTVTAAAVPGVAVDPKTLNKIEICVGTAEECSVATPPDCSYPNTWGFVRITRAGTTNSKYKCIARWEHLDFPLPLPAASRWRWVLDDETTWTKCSAGCCEVH